AGTTVWTPGPNNTLLAYSGARFGLTQTWPHVLGITFGFPMMVFLVGFFLGELFQRSDALQSGLHWGGAAVLLWIAWKIASSGSISGTSGKPRPFTFLEAVAFQWVNPKGWTMAIAVPAQFMNPDRPLITASIVAGAYVLMGFTSATGWAVLGTQLTKWLTTDNRQKWFNFVMGLLIAGCVVLLWN
ncbi:MAG: LysE family transporter, partial [Planctomycetales bacterium]|nr:LysE family transporter [Planctomycetales bacterium]NIM08804.1 LysE family transporter [Planctomycetales bacterium]NIN08269.1 LysE family transporter [Planctomycetales bacterium]NIP04447.1 LysE family transporter [Planctomycetales bacterium]NIP69370.1 LysE family transporter [Planctomycetales bacterium]